jgi:hypothetical protein
MGTIIALMKSLKKPVFIIFLISSVLAAVYYYFNHLRPRSVRVHYKVQDLDKKKSHRKALIANKQKVNSLDVKKRKEEDDFNREEFNKLMSRLNNIERRVKDRSRICSDILIEVLPNDDYIDINDEMYDEVNDIIEAFVGIINGAMFRPESMSGYSIINSIIEEEYPIDPLIMYKRIERLDVCRDPKALNFIDTVFEAYNQKKWPINVRNKLVNEVVNLFNASIEGNKSIENLLYFNNLFLIMSDNGVIPKTYTEELEDLGRRMNENHNLFKEGFGPRQTRESNLVALGDYLRQNEEFASDLSGHVSDIYEQLEIK